MARPASTDVVLFSLLLLLSGTAGRTESAIHWFKDLKQASKAAQQTNRPMMIDFWADWCAPCSVMDTEVYTNPVLTEAVNQRIVAVRINFDMQQELARNYNVEALPHLVFTNSYGTELMHHRGFLKAQDLTAIVNALPADLFELNRLDRALQEDKNQFEGLLEMGRQLRAAGLFESSSRYYARALKKDEAKKNPGKREFILLEMGLNFLAVKDAKQATQVFEKCLKEFPKSENRPNLLLNLAQAFTLSEQKEKARKLLQALMAEFPESEASRKAQALVSSM